MNAHYAIAIYWGVCAIVFAVAGKLDAGLLCTVAASLATAHGVEAGK